MSPLSQIDYPITAQPSETTCGPTCLHSVYAHYGAPMALGDVIEQTQALEGGGTLAVFLGIHALKRGWKATIETLNLQLFDPSWFAPGAKVDLAAKLAAQKKAKPGKKLGIATDGYLEFLRLGGRVRFRDMKREALRERLRHGKPVIAGLSATYLYGCARETADCVFDDVAGEPSGHFVVLCGYDEAERLVLVADPLYPRAPSPSRLYAVPIARVINSILLGVLSYDANMLVIEPPMEGRKWRC